MTGVYNPKTVILHAALHHQGCPHCELFSTAATRRCLDRVSVPVCLIVLSDQVPVIALVSRYLANKLIGREPILERQPLLATFILAEPWGINPGFPGLSPSQGHVIHVLLTRAPLKNKNINTFVSPCDLHVLNTPPAFILSQNQTLRKKFGWRSISRYVFQIVFCEASHPKVVILTRCAFPRAAHNSIFFPSQLKSHLLTAA